MIYSDGIKTDEKLRVLECPNCKNTQFGKRDQYCIICGTILYNECLGQDRYDDRGHYQGTDEKHINPGNARFCASCGTKTVFFDKGFLVPFNEYIETTTGEITQLPQVEVELDSDGDLPFL